MSYKKVSQRQVDTIALTGTAPFYSTIFNVQDAEGYCMQVDLTGGSSLTATASIQASNNAVNNSSGWATVNNESIAITGTSGTFMLEIPEDQHDWTLTQLKIQASAGSGNLVITTVVRSRQD